MPYIHSSSSKMSMQNYMYLRLLLFSPRDLASHRERQVSEYSNSTFSLGASADSFFLQKVVVLCSASSAVSQFNNHVSIVVVAVVSAVHHQSDRHDVNDNDATPTSNCNLNHHPSSLSICFVVDLVSYSSSNPTHLEYQYYYSRLLFSS